MGTGQKIVLTLSILFAFLVLLTQDVDAGAKAEILAIQAVATIVLLLVWKKNNI
jgi:hypothetical protein